MAKLLMDAIQWCFYKFFFVNYLFWSHSFAFERIRNQQRTEGRVEGLNPIGQLTLYSTNVIIIIIVYFAEAARY